LNFTTPLEKSADTFFAQTGSYDKCRIYAEKEKSPSIIPNLNVESCSSENFSKNKACWTILLNFKFVFYNQAIRRRKKETSSWPFNSNLLTNQRIELDLI
jgi:hypothetical protein